MVFSSFSIGEGSPRAPQPGRIITPLKLHQLACVKRAVDMERQVNKSDHNTFMCNMGLIADRRGSGVMLTALAIVAANSIDNIHVCAPRRLAVLESGAVTRQRILNSLVVRVPCVLPNNTYTFLNSVVVGATAIVTQKTHYWHNEIVARTRLNCLIISHAGSWFKLKSPTIREFVQTIDAKKIDVVVISRAVVKYMLASGIKGFTRIIYDTQLRSSDVATRKTFTEFDFLWTLSDRTCPHLFDTEVDVASEIMIRTEPRFLFNSMNIPEIVSRGYVCRLRCTGVGALTTLYDICYHKRIMLFPQLGDIRDTFRILGWSDNTVEQIARTTDIKWLPDKLARLCDDECGVCHSAHNHPVLLSCGHVFCGSCIIVWMQSSPTWGAWLDSIYPPGLAFKISCPECRKEISAGDVCSLVTGAPEPAPVYNDEEAVRIISQDRSRKYVVCYKHYVDSDLPRLLYAAGVDFSEVTRTYGKDTGISHLKNSTPEKPSVLLLDKDDVLKGCDLSFVSDLIIFDGDTPTENNNALVCAAQRMGRKEALVVHHLRPVRIDGAIVPVTYKHLCPFFAVSNTFVRSSHRNSLMMMRDDETISDTEII